MLNIKVQVPSLIDDGVTACLNELLFDTSAMLQFGNVHVEFTSHADSDTYVYECDFFLDNMTTRDVLWYTLTTDGEEEGTFDHDKKWLGVADHPSLIIVTPNTQQDYIDALNKYVNCYVQIAINLPDIGDEYDTIRQTEEGWTLYWDGATPF